MRCQIKEMINNKWVTAEYDTMIDKSILEWAAENFNRVVIVKYHDNGIPNHVICNDNIDVDMYLERGSVKDEEGKLIHYKYGVSRAEDELKLFGKAAVPKVVIDVFPDGKVIEVKTL